jgi:hypothetical protein
MDTGSASRLVGKAGAQRLRAHLIGFVGANLVCSAGFMWACGLVSFLAGGHWAPSPSARLVARALGGAEGCALALDAVLIAASLIAGIAVLASASRRLLAAQR